MEEEFKRTYELVEENLLLDLELPENEHFITETRKFQDDVKALEQKLKLNDRLIKNVYFISSELVQAVIHNGVFKKDLFVNCVKLAFSDNKFLLLSQNLVEIKNIPRIQIKFEEVNTAFDSPDSKEELQLRYKYKLKNTPMTKSGISVGVLDLARRSMNKILYDFKLIDDVYAIFSIICTVDVD